MSEVIQALLPYVLTALGVAGTAAMAMVGVWLGGRASTSRLAAFSERLWVVAQSVVAHVAVTMRPKLQAALADGKLSPEEGRMLKHEALRLLREAIGEHGLTELRKRLNLAGGAPAVDVFLSGLVERVLSTQKALQPPTPAVAVAKAVVQTRAPAVPPLASGQATVRTGP